MKIRLSIFAIALVVVANALVLVGVAWNRSGQPASVLELTERELALSHDRWSNRESTGVSLSLRLADQDYDWLDAGKLAELGFDVVPADRDDGRYWRGQERRLFVALEYDGPAFEALLDQQRSRLERLRSELAAGGASRHEVEAARSGLERLLRAGSRLVAVDAGTDADALRNRYANPERHVVTRGLLRMHAIAPHGRGEDLRLRGRVGRLLPGEVYLPRRFHEALRQATDEQRNAIDAPPRYRVEIRWGRGHEPWITGVVPIDPP
ncbi:DUF4824 family protein [Wenzhouxiangella sediminis]|uniref:DUF4824 family protein n=1 Tax=Wenzhouxiangella sediminis TaxID=1792836 RepID=A0A3E1K8M4_9GAMM|nr:DUF4824 family protein [Wenzhouxiangella sediminis]RFF30436.1 DUF4824 family protein [Wenzhouxiangella sediminis]